MPLTAPKGYCKPPASMTSTTFVQLGSIFGLGINSNVVDEQSQAIIQSLTLKLMEQAKALEPGQSDNADLKAELAVLKERLAIAEKVARKGEELHERDGIEMQGLRRLVFEADAQRDSFCHQVNVVNERLEQLQYGNKWLKRQLEMSNERYHSLWEDVHEHNAGRLHLERPDSRTRSVSSQTMTCQPPQPAIVCVAISMDEALAETLKQAQQEAAVALGEARCCAAAAIEQVQQQAAGAAAALEAQVQCLTEQLMCRKAAAETAEQQHQAAIAKLQQEVRLLQQQALEQGCQVQQLQQELEAAKGACTAVKMEYNIVERKYRRSLEEGLQLKEDAAKVEKQMDGCVGIYEELCAMEVRADVAEKRCQWLEARCHAGREWELHQGHADLTKSVDVLLVAKEKFEVRYGHALRELQRREACMQQLLLLAEGGQPDAAVGVAPVPEPDGVDAELLGAELAAEYERLLQVWGTALPRKALASPAAAAASPTMLSPLPSAGGVDPCSVLTSLSYEASGGGSSSGNGGSCSEGGHTSDASGDPC